MLQELSHMDRITQLQDEIQQVCLYTPIARIDAVILTPMQLLQIMSSSVAYLTSRTNFLQVSPEVPVTKSRNPEKVDAPDVLESALLLICTIL
jgi:mediator of RNA polymerase II transcription subunit 21